MTLTPCLQDIYVGLAFSTLLIAFIFPLVDILDPLLVCHPLAPAATVSLSVAAVVFYPGSDRWTPARGDTTVILAVYLGVQLGYWANFRLGYMAASPAPGPGPPYPILWPTFEQYGHTLLRMIVGGVTYVATHAVFKSASYRLACAALGVDAEALRRQPRDIRNVAKIRVELFHKFVTYVAVGFDAAFVVPIVFQAIGIERSKYYTEV